VIFNGILQGCAFGPIILGGESSSVSERRGGKAGTEGSRPDWAPLITSRPIGEINR